MNASHEAFMEDLARRMGKRFPGVKFLVYPVDRDTPRRVREIPEDTWRIGTSIDDHDNVLLISPAGAAYIAFSPAGLPFIHEGLTPYGLFDQCLTTREYLDSLLKERVAEFCQAPTVPSAP